MPSVQLELAAPVVRPSDQIDHYLIDSVAARSGMASIFRATDLRTGSPVAIKVPTPKWNKTPRSSPVSNVKRDCGDLNHPGVMKVFNEDDRSHYTWSWSGWRP